MGAKAGTISKIYGDFNDFANSFFVDVVTMLYEISVNWDFNVLTRDEAKTLYEKFLKFEIVLAAVSFQRIFNKTTPLS